MNDEGKLLSDIISKVLLYKTGSHDYLSSDMFKILIVIICRKRIDWGAMLFGRINDSFRAPNFGSFISLYLNQLDKDTFDMSKGVHIHHLKKIDSTIFSRWERRIPRQGGLQDLPEIKEEKVPAERIPTPTPREIPESSCVGIEEESAETQGVTDGQEPVVIPSSAVPNVPLPVIQDTVAETDDLHTEIAEIGRVVAAEVGSVGVVDERLTNDDLDADVHDDVADEDELAADNVNDSTELASIENMIVSLPDVLPIRTQGEQSHPYIAIQTELDRFV
ncbi:hypothetical protein KSP39_PZI012394 [Platanthera zijinensis]|uniref:Uncharacterized protein n=1 Tax=Platanthera zijinensis TaxID=2320716 RepID=A0AAP0G4R0_9ASPA